MGDCDDFFEAFGVPFEPPFEALAVRTVMVQRAYPDEKKWLIMCWFDTTYGGWHNNRFDPKDSRQQMANYLRGTNFKTYEEMIAESNLLE